jgi:RecB family exonuclease
MAFKGRSPKPPELRLPTHISHSARETLGRCARSYFLKYLAKAPQTPALWLAGGSAVHEVTEKFDAESFGLNGNKPMDWQEQTVRRAWNMHFHAQLEELRAKDPNEYHWRSSASEPVEAWNRMGPEYVQGYIDWRRRAPYEIWTTPDGLPAIELDISGKLPGCEVEIKGYLDRVFWDPVFKKLVIVDLKTSKKPPKNAEQFGTYAALLQVKYGVKADIGVPFMNRKNTLGKPYEMAEFTPEAVGAIYGEAWARIQSGEFPADGYDKACFICDVSAACAAKNGPLAHIYDPAAKVPF